jgi:hypothetical protein
MKSINQCQGLDITIRAARSSQIQNSVLASSLELTSYNLSLSTNSSGDQEFRTILEATEQ